ncbi:MAG: hypothetical protein M9944_16080 [Rhizobiaceae bacterium]|nr:hypothetical protein [Rhizobiaceae bacterium]
MSAVDIETVKQTDAQKKAQRSRSIAIALALVAFVIMVYVVSIVKLGPNILDRTF